jgi:prepilin-type N-terminal cleavage/methylation domain-containing protein
VVTIDRRPDAPQRRRSRRRRGMGGGGFTLLEMTIVLIIGGVLMGMAALTFGNVATRGSARRAAQVFSRDLAMARSMAVRGREKVVIRFQEAADSLGYEVVTASGRELAVRRFGADQDVNLSAIDLTTTGDSLVFSNRGVATLAAAIDSATFSVGAATYLVTFNGMGASRVGEL